MISAKDAAAIAKRQAADFLAKSESNLEEIERESYKGRDVWSITLSFLRDPDQLPPITRISGDPLQYKRFLIDVETGELVAMKLRELASR